ncbi:uncharacterized protein LOC111623300 isoform X3 [Centruroides sculpturatus]|nr:uncharacterized protein LOC111623300 isoform X3 [Centruroides sculpturatus]
MLNNCTQVHVGPKIEIHFEESKANSLKKEEEVRDAMLKSCCQMLKNKYKTYFSYMRSFLWEGKRKDFPLKDYFVELTVEKADLFGKNSEEKISLNEMFSIKEDGHQTILITGDPGYGKSTLCKKIAYDWATTDYLKHFDLTFIVILRELGDKSVKDALLDNMHKYSLINTDWKFQDRQRNILVILDGLDEIVEKFKILKFIREESFYITYQMTIVVTSRPQAAEDIREDMNMRLSLQGFPPEHQKKYIQLMFREDESKAKELSCALKENEFYEEISECPLMLHMLCCLHQNGEIEKLETMTDLYIRIFTLITERYVRKTNQQGKFKKGKYFVGENLLLKLVKIKNITSELLTDQFPKEDEYNFIIGLDILVLDSFFECDNRIQYSFLHRTFKEFLSALLMYLGNVSFPVYILEMELLFLLGFYKDKPLTKQFLTYLEEQMFPPQLMLRVHKTLKLKANWEQFCFHSNVLINFSKYVIYFLKLLKLHEFKEVYIYFGEKPDKTENNSIYYLNNCTSPNNLKIFLIFEASRPFWGNKYDIRKSVSCHLNLLDKNNTNNLDIFLVGVKMFVCGPLIRFKKVNRNLNLSGGALKLLNVSENAELISLESEIAGKFSMSFIISLEQYETLRDRIMISVCP